MSHSSTIHTRAVTHLRAALRSPMGLAMLIVMLLGMAVAMFFLMG